MKRLSKGPHWECVRFLMKFPKRPISTKKTFPGSCLDDFFTLDAGIEPDSLGHLTPLDFTAFFVKYQL